jgi:hypothetical protein
MKLMRASQKRHTLRQSERFSERKDKKRPSKLDQQNVYIQADGKRKWVGISEDKKTSFFTDLITVTYRSLVGLALAPLRIIKAAARIPEPDLFPRLLIASRKSIRHQLT